MRFKKRKRVLLDASSIWYVALFIWKPHSRDYLLVCVCVCRCLKPEEVQEIISTTWLQKSNSILNKKDRKGDIHILIS